jgi:hypothetical protein
MTEEKYKDIPGYEGLYQASNMGNIRNVRTGRLLKSCFSGPKRDYLKVCLSKNGKVKTLKIHKLVAMAFLNHIPNGMNIVVDHINNIPTDNRLKNLQLISQRENLSKDKKGCSSRYVGVDWDKQCKKWGSRIRINKKLIHLGYFHDELEASNTYQSALENIDKYDGNPKKFRLLLKKIRKLDINYLHLKNKHKQNNYEEPNN